MAKPKKKRDLRARLGRTITPKTKGGGGAPAAPPNLKADEPQAKAPDAAQPAPTPKPKPKGVTPPPAGVKPPPTGVAAPPAGIGGSSPGAVAAPPFAQPPAQPAAPVAPADPFAAGAAAPQEKVVRLEFDDRLVKDAEVGKGRTLVIGVVAAICIVVGLGVGFFGGSTYENNKIFDRTVRDAQSIYGSVNEASTTINAAQRHVNTLVQTAAGSESEGEPPGVDYDAIRALQSLERPFDASAFTGKNYNAFSAETVHDLFQYLMNVERLWQDFRALAAMTLPDTAQEELNRTATATAEGAQTLYGAVLQRGPEGRVLGSLVFLTPTESGQVEARATRNGRARTLDVYSASEQEIEGPGEGQEAGPINYALLINNANSRGVLAEQTGAFGLFLNELRRIKPLIDQTVEIQGRLLQAISTALTEAGASTTAPAGEGE